MMIKWENIFRVIIFIIGVGLIAFSVRIYVLFRQQANEIDAMHSQQRVEEKMTSNKLKGQEDQMDHLSKDLDDAKEQVKDQKDALSAQKDAFLQEVHKRQEVEDSTKGVQASLTDIKAETDVIKEQMKAWQKDYVNVLAQLEKKMDDTQYEIKAFETNLKALNISELKSDISSIKNDIAKMAK